MTTSKLLENQIAIVTGAGRGIGRATALALANAGAAVILAARSKDEITSLAGEITDSGGKALAIPTDVSHIGQVDHLLVLTLRAFGGVDILVNNAAVLHPIGKVWESSPLAWQKLIAINVIGPYLCARAVLPHLLDKGQGRIINLSSAAADADLEGTSAYNASKAAMERFSGTLAAEVANTGVVVTTLRPDIVDTSMLSEIRNTPAHLFPGSGDWHAWFEAQRVRSPVEPARAVLWLASKYADQSNGRRYSLEDEAFRRQVSKDLGLEISPSNHAAQTGVRGLKS